MYGVLKTWGGMWVGEEVDEWGGVRWMRGEWMRGVDVANSIVTKITLTQFYFFVIIVFSKSITRFFFHNNNNNNNNDI